MPAAATSATYAARRGALEAYFDRTAADAWARLTSDAPVSGIRATVRAGRDAMRATLLSWLPDDLGGARVLDAGCGTGALAMVAAARGADVLAADLSPTLLALAAERAAGHVVSGRVEFRAGDMLAVARDAGPFDHVVAMDSLIHYRAPDIASAVAALAASARRSVLFTVAPWTPALGAMHAVGRLFPRADRAPAVEPVREAALRRRLAAEPGLEGWAVARSHRVSTGFYISHALELVRR